MESFPSGHLSTKGTGTSRNLSNKAIKASVGGYFGGYYDVTIDLRNHETTWNFYEGGTEETSKKSIRVSTAEVFLEELKILNLLNWKAKYIELGV